MKPTDIKRVLDLTWNARNKGMKFTPLFMGEAGLGKSEISQAWVKDQHKRNPDFGFLDIRLAYMEGPDFIGLPDKIVVNGVTRSVYDLPEFWPTEGEGLILFEEINRAHSSVMNCLMQILTDRKVHKYVLPDGWIMASCVNPNNGYDVNEIDKALLNRFASFNIEYDHTGFKEFITQNNWDSVLQAWVKSSWTYKKPNEIQTDGFYISPRSLSILNTGLKAGAALDRELHFELSVSTLGEYLGREFHKYTFEEKPILAEDLLGTPEEYKKAINTLKKQCNTKDKAYRGDLVSATVTSIVENFPNHISEEILSEVASIIPADLSVSMILDASKKIKDGHLLDRLVKKYPDLETSIKSKLRAAKQQEGKKDK
jgi:hypothetical protein